jgi:hypothetical protein
MNAGSSSPVSPLSPSMRKPPRKGFRAWWTRTFVWQGERFLLDGFGDLTPAQALAMRRKALRSFIASVAIGAILLGDVGFIFIGLSEPLVWVCQAAGALALLLALSCNRRGWVGLAAVLAVFAALAAVWPTIWFYPPGLTVDAWPGFDILLLGPVVLVAVFERQR